MREGKFEDLIESIKMRPKMFMEENRLDYIFYFLFGQLSADGYLLYTDSTLAELFYKDYFKWLSKWLKTTYLIEKMDLTYFWYKMIYSVAKDEHDSLAIFYKSFSLFSLEVKNDNINFD